MLFLLGDSPLSEFNVPIFWNALSVPGGGLRWDRQSVLKYWHIKFRHWEIIQKK